MLSQRIPTPPPMSRHAFICLGEKLMPPPSRHLGKEALLAFRGKIISVRGTRFRKPVQVQEDEKDEDEDEEKDLLALV